MQVKWTTRAREDAVGESGKEAMGTVGRKRWWAVVLSESEV
jgi:hypothetical protein